MFHKLVVKVVKDKDRLTACLWPSCGISAPFQIIKNQKPAVLLASHFRIITCPVLPLSLLLSLFLNPNAFLSRGNAVLSDSWRYTAQQFQGYFHTKKNVPCCSFAASFDFWGGGFIFSDCRNFLV